jgi:hypothetical protein
MLNQLKSWQNSANPSQFIIKPDEKSMLYERSVINDAEEHWGEPGSGWTIKITTKKTNPKIQFKKDEGVREPWWDIHELVKHSNPRLSRGPEKNKEKKSWRTAYLHQLNKAQQIKFCFESTKHKGGCQSHEL